MSIIFIAPAIAYVKFKPTKAFSEICLSAAMLLKIDPKEQQARAVRTDNSDLLSAFLVVYLCPYFINCNIYLGAVSTHLNARREGVMFSLPLPLGKRLHLPPVHLLHLTPARGHLRGA